MRAPQVANGTTIADERFQEIAELELCAGQSQHNLDLAIERTFPVMERKDFVFGQSSSI